MNIVIGCVDGERYYSRDFDRKELENHIKETGGYVGTGDLANVKVETVEELMEALTSLLKYDSSTDTQTFNMEMSGGGVRHFNVRHVVWWEVLE